MSDEPARSASPAVWEPKVGLLTWMSAGATLGVLCGLAETVPRAWTKLVLHEVIRNDHHVFWMVPVSLGMLLALVAGGLAVATRWQPNRVGPRLLLAVLTGLGLADLLWQFERLHTAAVVLLALGVGIQTGRWLGSRAARVVQFASRWSPLALAVCLVLSVVVGGWYPFNERRHGASLPPEPSGKPPNVLLIVLDTVRASNLSLHGHSRPTSPRLDAMAAGGIVFDHAFSPAPWTLPGHAGMFTGLPAHELQADWWQPLESEPRTLAEELSARGYDTAGIVANTWFGSRQFGLNRGFAHYDDLAPTFSRTLFSSGLGKQLERLPLLKQVVWRLTARRGDHRWRKTADMVNRDALSWIDRPRNRPFFLFLNYFDAHDPYVPPDKEFHSKFGAKSDDELMFRWETALGEQLTADDFQVAVDAYDSSLAYLDDRLGRLWHALDERGLLENTLLIVTADHGDHFGEHGLVRHGNSGYRQLLEVPLILVWPGHLPARRIETPVGLTDLPATIAELVTTQSRGAAPEPRFPGRSLSRFWQPVIAPADGSDESVADPVIGSVRENPKPLTVKERKAGFKGQIYSIVADGWHYVTSDGDVEELFDFASDPSDQRDLSRDPEKEAILERFREHKKRYFADSTAKSNRNSVAPICGGKATE